MALARAMVLRSASVVLAVLASTKYTFENLDRQKLSVQKQMLKYRTNRPRWSSFDLAHFDELQRKLRLPGTSEPMQHKYMLFS